MDDASPGRRRLPCREAGDVAALPGSLDSTPIVIFAYERDGFRAGHAVEDRQAGKRRSSASAATGTGDLDPFSICPLPCLGQGPHHGGLVGRQAEIRPPQPA
jgi:hypothetical protein